MKTLPFYTNLKWQKDSSMLLDDEKKILIALSNKKYKWRTKEGLKNATGFSNLFLEQHLANLIGKKIVRSSLSKDNQIVFGLRERVD